MNKYQKILNLLAINSNALYRYQANGRANYRIKIENDDTILFYEGDHKKPDSKKVVNFKKGTYATYENINWQDQTKPVVWKLYREFLILDYQHILDGLCECPIDLEHNPYINKKAKDTNETAYVQYIFQKPNESMINGIRRVWINSKKDIKKQVMDAGKLINGYAKYWITDKQVKANVLAFNKSKTFSFKTKFNLYVTNNEHYFNFLAPKEFFMPFKQILKELGFNYVWKEIKGEDIFKFDPETNSIFYMLHVLGNWYNRGSLSSKNVKFFKTIPPIAKEYPFLITPDDKIIKKMKENSQKAASRLTCNITDRKLLDIASKLLKDGYRYGAFSISFSGDRLFITTSIEEYDSKTKKWDKGLGGFTVIPVVPSQFPVWYIRLLAELIALSNHANANEFIQKIIEYTSKLEVKGEEVKKLESTIEYMQDMLNNEISLSIYFKINAPKFKNKVFYISKLPVWMLHGCLQPAKLDKLFERIEDSKVDKTKVIPICHLNILDYFDK